MPVANEEETMRDVIDSVMALDHDNLYLYVVIDAFSKDRTEEIIREAEKDYNGRVKCLFFKKSSGCVSCYLYGFTKALEDGAEYIVEMDGGGSHDPQSIPDFIKKLDEGYDCAFGSRFVEGGGIYNHPLYRRLLSAGGTILANLVLGTKLKDMTSGYEAFRREVLENMDLRKILSRGHMYQTEMRYYCRNYNICEVPITYIGSTSALKFKTVIEALVILFMLKGHESKVMKKEI